MEIENLKKNLRIEIKPVLFIKILFWSVFFGGLFLKCFYFQYTSKINARPFLNSLNIYMYIGSLGSLFLMASILIIAFNKKRYHFALIVHLLLTLLFLADTIYFRYYYHPLSVTVLYQIGVVDSIGGSALSLFKIKDIVFILDLPVLFLLFLFIKRKGINSFHILKRAATGFLLLVMGIFLVHASYGKAYKASFTIDNNYVCKYLGVSYYHYYDVKNFVKETFLEDRKLTAEEKEQIDQYFASKKPESKNYNGIARGKNLIVLQVEALQEFIIGRKINGQEITPNLNKLIRESAYFNNIYYQIGDGNTSDAEFLANNSLYPVRHGSVNFRYAGNTYLSLPNILKKEGYDTQAFHANRPSFWNRSVMFDSLGFRLFNGNPSFTLDDKVGWGLSDDSFLKQSLNLIDIGKPFYSLMITLSSHFPYNFDYSSKSSLDVGKLKNSLLGRYMIAENYTDSCIGNFVKNLKTKGLYDNSVLVIYGDHYGIPKEDTKDLASYLNMKNDDLGWTKLQKVPLIIHYPGLENGKLHSLTGGELDIMPTLLNLFGIDSRQIIGKDLLNTDNGYALLRNGSLVTDKYVYLNTKNMAYDINTGELYTDGSYKDDLKKYMQEYEISQLIVEKNAFEK